MVIDPRTVFIMGVGFLAFTTITLGLLVPTLPKDTQRSALVGTLATASLGFSWALIALEGLILALWSLLAGNLPYLVAAALMYQSIRLLDGAKVNRGAHLYVLGAAIVVTLVARYVKGRPTLALRGHLLSRIRVRSYRVRFAYSGGNLGEAVGAGPSVRGGARGR